MINIIICLRNRIACGMCWMKNLPRRFSLCVVGLSAVENWLNCCPIVTGFYSWSAAPKKGRSRTGGCRRAPENWGRKGEGWRNYLFFYYYVYRRLLLASLSLFLSLILFSYLFIFSFVWWWCPSHLWVHSLSPVYNQPQKPARLLEIGVTVSWWKIRGLGHSASIVQNDGWPPWMFLLLELMRW
jgi:hypothetical protein